MKFELKLGLGRILNFATGSGSGYYPAAKNRIRISGWCRIPDFFLLKRKHNKNAVKLLKNQFKKNSFFVEFFSGRIKIESCVLLFSILY